MSKSKVTGTEAVSIQLTNVKTGAQETTEYSGGGMKITQGRQAKQEKK